MTTSPVVVTAEFIPAEGRVAELRQALSEGIPAVHSEPGCLLYAIHEAPHGRIFMIEKWESTSLLDDHASGDAVAKLNALIADLIREPVRVVRLTPIPAGTSDQGLL